jgi:uncharacterized protein (DUF362 family)
MSSEKTSNSKIFNFQKGDSGTRAIETRNEILTARAEQMKEGGAAGFMMDKRFSSFRFINSL